MSLKERIYSVLVVSSAENFNGSLPVLLPEQRFTPVKLATSVSSAKRLSVEREFDFVIVNSPLQDDIGVRFAIDSACKSGTVVLLIVKNSIYPETRDKVSQNGVFTLPKPLGKSSFEIALDWMSTARERLRSSEKKTVSVEEKMEEIRIVNRAKWLLISKLKMTEPQAHRYIEKQAMDRCVSRREIADELIKTYS